MTRSAPTAPRFCAICDGMDGLLRMASYLADLPANLQRTDLDVTAALEMFSRATQEPWDQIVLAVETGGEVQPRALEALLSAALEVCSEVIWLVSPEQVLPLGLEPRLRVLRGPPFTAVDLPSEAVAAPLLEPRHGLLRRLLSHRMRAAPLPAQDSRASDAPLPKPGDLGVIAVQAAAGGAGASTLAANLALTLAEAGCRVCVLDLNLQFGAQAAYFGLSASEAVVDIYRRIERLDLDLFQSGLRPFGTHLQVFSAPAEILPIDGLSSTQLYRMLDLAREAAEVVIVDLPHVITDWSASMYRAADLVLAVALCDVRSGDNLRKLRQLLESEDVDCAHFHYLLNRTPIRMTAAERAEETALIEGLGQGFLARLSEGGDSLRMAANRGVPICHEAPKNIYARDVSALAAQLVPRLRRFEAVADEGGRRYV